MSLALVVVLGASITLVITQGSVFDGLRRRGPTLTRELASCPLCLGVWVGSALACYAARSVHLELPLSWATAPYLLGIGCLTGVVALSIHRAWEALDACGGDDSSPAKVPPDDLEPSKHPPG